MYAMQPYDDALEMILKKGVVKSNKRTGIKTLAICGMQTRYRIDECFPVMTRRKYYPKAVFAELLWFISGSTCNEDLKKLGCNFWTPWVSKDFTDQHGYAEGVFGEIYGFQLRYFGGHYGNGKGQINEISKALFEAHSCEQDINSYQHAYGFGGFDQLAYMMQRIKEDPSDRRILFSLWNPRSLEGSRLPPCHYTFQIFIDDEGRMSGHLTQRSCDWIIGVCANIQFYSALTCMIAQQTGYKPYEFIHEGVDAHIYWDQIDAVKQYLETPVIDSPKLVLNKAEDIYSYKTEDFVLEDFNCGPKIEIPVAV